jgi:hypothetical protein
VFRVSLQAPLVTWMQSQGKDFCFDLIFSSFFYLSDSCFSLSDPQALVVSGVLSLSVQSTSTCATLTQAASSSNDAASIGRIVGASVGAVVFGALIAVFIVYLIKRQKSHVDGAMKKRFIEEVQFENAHYVAMK